MATKQHLEYHGYAFLEKTVRNTGNSGRVFVPKSWAGKKVAVVLLEPPAEEEKRKE